MSRPARVAVGLAVLVAAVLYCAPVVVLWQATGRALPPWVSSDTYLYLNLSRAQVAPDGQVRNPWYGNLGRAEQVPYLRFGLAPRLFHLISVLSGDDAIGLVAWHLLMVLAIALTLLWMLRGATRGVFLLLAGFVVVMFVDVAYARADLAQMRTGVWRWVYGLPFARTFYPQVGVPFLFAFVGSLVRWLADRRTGWLALMGVLQFGALTAFPYEAVVIVTGAVVTAAAARVLGVLDRRGVTALLFSVVAWLAVDALWYFTGSRAAFVTGPLININVDFSQLRIGPPIVRPLLLGLAALFLPGDRGVRAVFGSFAIAVALPQFADAVLTPALLVGHHIAYFYTIGFWLPLIAIAGRAESVLARIACATVVAAVTVFAILDSRATGSLWQGYNADNGELARALRAAHAGDGDVVVTPIHGFRSGRAPQYWENSWVPLVSTATVLYSPHGRLLLPAGSPEEAERLATYLFLEGEDAQTLDAMLSSPTNTAEQSFLVGFSHEPFLESSARDATLADVRRTLRPELEARARGEIPGFLKSARRVILADYRDAPVFSEPHAASLLTFTDVLDAGAWRIRFGYPRR